MSVSVIICAAGRGTRTGFEKNKLLVPYLGIPVLERTICAFCIPEIDEIILSVHEADLEEISVLQRKYGKVRTVIGGETRSISVYNALKEAKGEIVLVHDGARPFVSPAVIRRCIQSVKDYTSGICALPVTDTIALASGEEIQSYSERKNTYAIQTPQGFLKDELLLAYEKALSVSKLDYTDDSSLFAAFVRPAHLCEGDVENKKLTFRSDFYGDNTRIGFGVDTHAFGKEQNYIILGGEQVPSFSGLIAHSDGDVLVHALMDALLSAIGKRDIGHYFPDTDDKWKDASSIEMLTRVHTMIKEEGYVLKNVSCAIQAEKPRLAPYIEKMTARLSEVLSLPYHAVGISAGTNEKLGYVGEGKGITVYATVLLSKE